MEQHLLTDQWDFCIAVDAMRVERQCRCTQMCIDGESVVNERERLGQDDFLYIYRSTGCMWMEQSRCLKRWQYHFELPRTMIISL